MSEPLVIELTEATATRLHELAAVSIGAAQAAQAAIAAANAAEGRYQAAVGAHLEAAGCDPALVDAKPDWLKRRITVQPKGVSGG